MKFDKTDFGVAMMALTFLGGLAFSVWMVISATGDIVKAEKENQSYVGKEIVVGKDTLIVTSAPVFGAWKLSNGIKIDQDFVKNKLSENENQQN